MDPEKKREQDRQRKAEWREKQKQIKENTYAPTPIERAKYFLEQMDEPDVDSVFKDENIGKLLKPDDRKTLINFSYNLKSRRRKDEE
jgi:hypothetical protein